jgi:hypothetical protein
MIDEAGSVLVSAVGVEHTRAHDGTLAALVGALRGVGAVVNREVRHVFSGSVRAARLAAGSGYGGGGVGGGSGGPVEAAGLQCVLPGGSEWAWCGQVLRVEDGHIVRGVVPYHEGFGAQ